MRAVKTISSLGLGVIILLSSGKVTLAAKPNLASPRPGTPSASSLIRSQFRKAMRLLAAVVQGKSSSTLTVKKDGKEYSVDTSSAKINARFWGQLTLDDIQVNDKVNIWGTWTDETMTSIKARLIRDLSIQRRHATFFGTVKSIGSNSLVLDTAKRGSQNVSYVSGPIVNRKQEPVSFSAIRVGDKIRVRGLWDSASSAIAVDTSKDRVSQVKDFTLPLRPSPSATPVPSATP